MPSALQLFTAGTALVASAFAVPKPASKLHSVKVNTTGNTPVNGIEATQHYVPTLPYGGSHASSFFSSAWIPHGQSLKPKLSQQQSNGNSYWGLPNAPKLPPFLSGGPLPNGFPWGGRTAQNTNQYTDMPNTGVTRHYDFTLTYQTIAPDGVEKAGIVINGAFPGPKIEANWGDWIEVTVHNKLNEGTAMHWHGLLQKATQWMDGVPGVDQCPIAPGSTFTYRFQADLYGTSWYHSHFSAQFVSGIFGPLVIYGPHDNVQYDEDLGPVMLNDWFHTGWFSLVEQVMAPASEALSPPLSNNVLINGKMNYPCQNATAGMKCTPNAGVSKFMFQSGKTYRLRLINSGAEGMQKFSIDGHKITIFANDFVPIVPYTVDVVTLGVGQRSDVIVKATGKPTDAVWMRADLGPGYLEGGCSLPDGISPEGVAAIYYEKANQTAVPTSQSTVPASVLTTCENDPLSSTVPYYSIKPTTPDMVEEVAITFQSNGTHNLFYMNNSTFRSNYNDPILLDAKNGQKTYPAEYNVYDLGSATSVRIILYNYALTGSHPMHLHGHNFHVLATGTGTWDGTIVNSGNPQRRDVQLLPNAASPTEPTYIVLQYQLDNPGTWPLHCHIAWHVSGGLYINLLERQSDIQTQMQIPAIMSETCTSWDAWSNRNTVDEIDSGLKMMME